MSLSKDDKQLLVAAGNLANAACDLAVQEAENSESIRTILIQALEIIRDLTIRVDHLELESFGAVSNKT